ncbi:SDR family NAD(P)-dependent oxidoreductase [Salinivibrio kushneri]|uniref:SDR family NAD(P)-dependent oxidoreductase n=1 Tax=Salinivibrio kushneri TaxID=1908198 RepID=UPI000987D432|nr:SDR family NAD(P)-dependent oxidoreductase [Salinivibrio kushneri]OOE34920.1 short-chain dehydrogenase [Salinivibrio kushneri]OOE49019.1 short-chain dehydrogenase [Salinivibrio kushneri]OOE52431.1 short-chain dehydrogenase [Salinivibrio kushneri]OOE59307.1 short-chain dehydrogenase [Salinivibrio kushneri]
MKHVLITGATSGIGEQLARDYARQGWQVTACGRNQDKLNTMARDHASLDALAFDATDSEQTHQALSNLSVFPDLIILNAGTCEYIDHGKVDVALFKRVFEINVFGVLHCIEALQARFTHSTHLAIVGSSASYMPLPRAEAYGGSKAAISYIANTLSVDLAQQGVTLSLISPGFVKTPLTDQNDFAMPMRITVEQASEAIQKGLAKGKTEIHFPRKFTFILKFLALLPMSWQRALARRMTRN